MSDRHRSSTPATVVVPTLGRPLLLRECLESLGRCKPQAAEVLVVDQSHSPEVRAVVAEFAGIGARIVTSDGRGAGAARNVGLREASHELVLMTDDDCTVDKRWVRFAEHHMEANPGALVTGQVLAPDNSDKTPSTINDPEASELTGEVHCGRLFTGNAVVERLALMQFGGFDERLRPAAEDNDLCYRWLRSGRSLHYEPDLVVWHQDWRSKAELRELYGRYGRGQGVFYAKHLSRGDATMLRFLLTDAYNAARSLALFWRSEERKRWGYHRKYLFGLVAGLRGGSKLHWRQERG